MPEVSPAAFGLFLNLGANLAADEADVFRFTLAQARVAERAGYHDLWVTEHHFIPFGLNPSALTTSAYLLGHVQNLRVGTAVALSPLHHPVDLAERAALLDQLSGGRFDLGIGRGGYVRDYEVFGTDTARWDVEPEATAAVLQAAWQGSSFAAQHPFCQGSDAVLRPRPLTAGGPPLFLATSSPAGIAYAARLSLPLQHYFATPPIQRAQVEARYAELCPSGPRAPHLHSLILLMTDDEPAARQQLQAALTRSFMDGDWPAVPQAANRHVDESGRPLDRSMLAARATEGALVGPPERIARELAFFMGTTGARRLALYMEAVADQSLTLESIERFAAEVVPRLRENEL